MINQTLQHTGSGQRAMGSCACHAAGEVLRLILKSRLQASKGKQFIRAGVAETGHANEVVLNP